TVCDAPLDPRLGHETDLSHCLRWNGILLRDCLQRPEPLVRLALQLAKDERHGSKPHADDLLVRFQHGHLGNIGEVPGQLFPLGNETLETFLGVRRGGGERGGSAHGGVPCIGSGTNSRRIDCEATTFQDITLFPWHWEQEFERGMNGWCARDLAERADAPAGRVRVRQPADPLRRGGADFRSRCSAHSSRAHCTLELSRKTTYTAEPWRRAVIPPVSGPINHPTWNGDVMSSRSRTLCAFALMILSGTVVWAYPPRDDKPAKDKVVVESDPGTVEGLR